MILLLLEHRIYNTTTLTTNMAEYVSPMLAFRFGGHGANPGTKYHWKRKTQRTLNSIFAKYQKMTTAVGNL